MAKSGLSSEGWGLRCKTHHSLLSPHHSFCSMPYRTIRSTAATWSAIF